MGIICKAEYVCVMILPTEMGQQSVNVSMKKKEEEETLFDPKSTKVTHLHETSRMSAEFVFRYGLKCMGGVILPILILLHL